ncbi:MAG: XRE family transcriptional regulator [Armatimonadota bacterium]|nr:XRE family transcriptional regulator [Armatimonadota bacterium]
MDGLANRIRELRQEKGMTLKEVSERTGFSVSFLSQVERGLSSLSITSLQALAETLGVPIVEFFPAPPVRNYARRRHEHQPFQLDGSQIQYVSLSGNFPSRNLEPLLVTLPPRLQRQEPFGHPGEEFAYVLSGRMTIVVDGEAYDLGPGDSIHFSSRSLHTFENPTDEPTVAVWVLTPKIF